MANIDNEIAAQEVEINSLFSQAEASAKSLGPSIPGVGDIAKTAEDEIKKEARKHAKTIKILGSALLLATVTGAAINNPEVVNRQIDNFNKFTDKIRSTIEKLKSFLKKIFPIIKIIMIAYIASKVISMIPAVTIGLGAGVAFTMHVAISESVKSVCQMLIDKIGKIPFAILAIITILLSLLKFIDIIMGIINSFNKQQDDLKNDQISDSLLSSVELEGMSTVKDNTDKLDKNLIDGDAGERIDLMKQINELNFQNILVDCTLPDGSVQQMTPDDCIAAGGTHGDLVRCTLPDGTIKSMTRSDCIAAGGTFGDNMADLENKLNNLGGHIDGACLSGPECINLSYEECLNSSTCYWDSGNLMITSLKHPDRDVTVEKATKVKGKRIGFYQSDIKT